MTAKAEQWQPQKMCVQLQKVQELSLKTLRQKQQKKSKQSTKCLLRQCQKSARLTIQNRQNFCLSLTASWKNTKTMSNTDSQNLKTLPPTLMPWKTHCAQPWNAHRVQFLQTLTSSPRARTNARPNLNLMLNATMTNLKHRLPHWKRILIQSRPMQATM